MGSFLDTGTRRHRFDFEGGPIDNFETAREAFEVLGHAAMAWARLESHVDAVLIHVNKAVHSTELYNPEHPIGFANKLKLLKRWFNQHPFLKSLAGEIREAAHVFKENLRNAKSDFARYFIRIRSQGPHRYIPVSKIRGQRNIPNSRVFHRS